MFGREAINNAQQDLLIHREKMYTCADDGDNNAINVADT